MKCASDPFEGHDTSFEGARLANMSAFAAMTPEQKLAWLGQMLELYNEIHGIARGTKRQAEGRAGGGEPNDPTT